MSIIEAIIQGIIQGATEFLPVSSSGHLSISQHIFGIELPGILFDLMLHLGTLIAVIFVYRKIIARLILEFLKLIADVFKGRFKWSEMDADRRLLMMLMIGLIPLFLLFCPVPGTGKNLKDYSELISTDTRILAEGIALLVTSILLFSGIRANKRINAAKIVTDKQGNLITSKGRRKIHVIDAVLIGLAQCMAAVFPGLSRSGSTLSIGLMRGINKKTALDYSFVLGIPAILAAAVVSIKDAGNEVSQIGVLPLILGVVTACVVGFLAIKLLNWIVTSDRLSIFAYYTLIVGGVVTVIGIIETVTGINLFTGSML